MIRSLLILVIVTSAIPNMVNAQVPAKFSRVALLEKEIADLRTTDCSDLADKGQGQAAIACENWREEEIEKRRRELVQLKVEVPVAPIPSMSGDAAR